MRKEIVVELAGRLESDPISQERFFLAFGLDPSKMQHPAVLSHITELFPETPVRLLKEVVEALQLNDLVDLLEKAKPRTLCAVLSLKEIGKLVSVSSRSTAFYSKIAVLIIDNATSTAASDTAKKIESFFKFLNSRCQVTTIAVWPLLKIFRDLSLLKNEKKNNERIIELDERD